MSDYWKECVEIGLEEAGISASEEQIEILAGSAESGHEYYGMAHGYDAIPNPMISEIDKIKAEHKKEIASLNKDIDCYKSSVAKRRKCHPSNVYLENGDVTYDLR